MAHTPGPWETIELARPNEGEILVGVAFDDPHKFSIATVCSGDIEITRDDARLIAAAPDLLEALNKIALGEGRYNRDPLTHASNTIEDMKALARAAIAKATCAYCARGVPLSANYSTFHDVGTDSEGILAPCQAKPS